jgi:Domain of unknown function (DUF4434)
MDRDLSRRGFARLIGTGAALAAMPSGFARAAAPGGQKARIKPILGSWISVLWSDRRHFYWNAACAKFSREQWEESVKEVADLGMQYLVLLATVEGGKAFFDTPLVPKAKELACGNPIEAMLSAADKYGLKFFISTGFHGGWLDGKTLTDRKIARGRFELMAQVAEKFAHHPSFYGWYLPDEPGINPYYSDDFIASVNLYGREGRRLVPRSKILIAPYGTSLAVCDDQYVRQLERIDADIVAYQDEVGCRRMTPEKSALAYEKLRKAHDKVPQRALWADVEVFDWEGPANQTTSPLIPAPFARIKKQLEAVSPYVDVVTIYQYQGLLSRPGSKVPSTHPGAAKLYGDYGSWLKSEYPALVK